MEKYDFSGWATKNDLQCSDGRIIRKDAFKHCEQITICAEGASYAAKYAKENNIPLEAY